MPSPKQHGPIETMQAIAWCAEVQNVSGLTPSELKKQCFEGANAPKFEFSMFSRGDRIPGEETLELVEQKYPGAKEVFELGPDKRQLWALLADECDEDLCMQVLDDWLFTGFSQSDLESIPDRDAILFRMKSSTLRHKAELAWEKMVGPNEVSFELFDAGEELHQMWESAAELEALVKKLEDSGIKIETPLNIDTLLQLPELDQNQKDELKAWSDYFHKTAPKLDDIVGIIALRRLSESRRESQSEARYLFLGMLPFIEEVFSEWNIGSHLRTFLASWSHVPTTPEVIATANQTTAEIVTTLRKENRKRLPTKEANSITRMLNRFKR